MWRGSTIAVNWDCLTVVGKIRLSWRGSKVAVSWGRLLRKDGGSNFKANFGDSMTIGLSPVNN